MKPKSSPQPAGMSRAAKKRAKKKQKLTEQPTEFPQATSTSQKEETIQKRGPTGELLVPQEKLAKKAKVEPRRVARREEEEEDFDIDTQKPGATPGSVEISAPSLPLICDTLGQIVEPGASESLATMPAKERATAALGFLLAPAGMTTTEFYSKYWEKQPVCIKDDTNQHRHRLDGFLSLKSIRQMLEQKTMYYGRDLNVTRYETSHKDGVKRRVTLDLVKARKAAFNESSDDLEDNFIRADPDIVWSHYEQGCTVRLLCPHLHNDHVHSLLSLLEMEWGCMVGANAYLTPPGKSQGFAPHYDDIEAFCLQLQGRKRWKVYEPLNKTERLPRVSSEDYTEEDLRGVEPVMDVILEPGDLLYMPRGWIHQACTLPQGLKEEGHSLHLTVSAMQQWAWADLMEILLPEALAAATTSESTLLRSGLPRNFPDYMGAMHDNREEHVPAVLKQQAVDPHDPEVVKAATLRGLQDEFRTEAKKRIMKVAKEAMEIIDVTCDEMAKRFLSDRLPPALTIAEKSETSQATTEGVVLLPSTQCRLVRPGIARLVLDSDKAVLYHCADNSRIYHELPLSPMEFEMDDAPALEQLMTTIDPHWVLVQNLIHDNIDDKVGVAQALFDEGILAIRNKEDGEDEES